MFIKVLCVVALAAVAVTAHPEGGPQCDTDLLYWARNDVFKPSVTNNIDNGLSSCGRNLGDWLSPTPCPNSCNELACKYACVVRGYDFVDDSGVIDAKAAEDFLKNYVYSESWGAAQVEEIAEKCAHYAQDHSKQHADYACPSTAYDFFECVYNEYHKKPEVGGDVIIDQNSNNEQNVNVGVDAGEGSNVDIGIIQDAENNQVANVNNVGGGNVVVIQDGENEQNANIGVIAGPDSNVAVGVDQNAQNNQVANVNNEGKGDVAVVQDGDNQQTSNVLVNAQEGSNVAAGVEQDSVNNQVANVDNKGKGTVVVDQDADNQQTGNVVVEAGKGSNVATGVQQDVVNNQVANVENQGKGNVVVKQGSSTNQNSNIAISTGTSSSGGSRGGSGNTNVAGTQDSIANQIANVFSSSKGNTVLNQINGVLQGGNIAISTGKSSSTNVGFGQNSIANQLANVFNRG